MKKITLLGIAAFLFSCSGDDSSSENQSLLMRKWYFKDRAVVGGETSPYTDHEPGCTKDYIEFVGDGVFRSVDFYEGCEQDIDTGTWVLDGTTLTVTFIGQPNSEVETNTINFVTETTLQIQSVYDRDGDDIPETVLDNFTAQ